MKLKDTYVRTDVFACTACGTATGPTTEVDDDESGVPFLPPGWARLTVEQLVPNPDYLEAVAIREDKINVSLEVAKSQQTKKLTKDEVAGIRELVASQIAEVDDDEQFIVVKTTVALCETHVKNLADLGLEEDV